MKKYYIGVDGGGTKTAVAIALAGEAPAVTALERGCSYQMLGTDGAVQTIMRGIAAALKKAGLSLNDCAGCCIGLPCYGEDAQQDAVMTAALRKALAPMPIHIVNDVEVGWAGALNCSAGIHLVAGTGSIAFGKNEAGQAMRCGGWNELFGDEGSCYWIGREAMSIYTKEADGRLPKSALYEIVRQALAITNDMDFIDLVIKQYAPYRDKVASFQRYAAQAAAAGDPAAMYLYERAAKELAMMVGALCQKLHFPDGAVVSYSGGLFHTGERVLSPLRKEVTALHCVLQAPRRSAVEGALLLAVQECHD